MAGLALGAVGAALAPAGYASLGWSIGSFIGNALFPGKLPDQVVQGPRLSDLKVQSSAYGQAIPKQWGVTRVTGNVIWSKPIDEHATTNTTTQGGKGGPSQTTTSTTYTYTVDMAVAVKDGTIVGVRRIWANGELVYNLDPGASADTVNASAAFARSIRVYPGDETQTADALIAADVGAANCPAYRGTAYVVLEAVDLTPFGNRVPQFEFELVSAGTAADLAVPVTATLIASDGSTARVLGRQGSVWHAATGNLGYRFGVYNGALLTTYPALTWGYVPAGLTLEGEAIATNSGGILRILHESGTVDSYTASAGGQASIGAQGIYAESDTVLWCRGDSGASTNFHRVDLNTGALTYVGTKLTNVLASAIAKNATGIAGRVYLHASDAGAGQKYLGYVDTASLAWVPLVAFTTLAGILVARDGTLWVGQTSSADLKHYDRDGALLGTVTLPESASWVPYEDAVGNLWVVGSPSSQRAYRVHPALGTVTGKSANFTGALLGFTEDNRAVVFDTVAGNYTLKMIEPLGRLTAGLPTLGTVVSEICAAVGLAAGDIDVTALTASVEGYVFARRDAARLALEPLMLAYAFDAVESDDKLKFVPRAGGTLVAVPEADLGAHAWGDEVPAAVRGARKLETELPREVIVNYPDKNAAHQVGTQYARRLTGSSVDVAQLDLAIVMDATKAAQVAELALYERWAARETREWSTTRRYAKYEPTDLMQVSAGAQSWLLRITDKEEDGGVIRWKGVTEDAAVYAPVGTAVALPAPVSAVSAQGVTALRLLDLPCLRDLDDDAGFYAAAAGYASGWRGAELYKSVDDGASFDRTLNLFLTAAVMGNALTALASFAGGNVFDELSTVDVQVFGGTLASVSEAQLLAGSNAALLGAEVIQFRTATLLSAGQYRLSGLLRGRKGTEQHIGTHAVGDQFVLLTSAAVLRVAATSAEIGAARVYKAPTFAQSVIEAVAYRFTNTGAGLMPLAPVQLGGGRNGAGDVTINWVRRARVGAEWRDYVDASLGEASELYDVEIWTSGYATLKRTFADQSSATVTYTAAQQSTDFGSNQATVYVRVYQKSATVGRGFKLEGTV